MDTYGSDEGVEEGPYKYIVKTSGDVARMILASWFEIIFDAMCVVGWASAGGIGARADGLEVDFEGLMSYSVRLVRRSCRPR